MERLLLVSLYGTSMRSHDSKTQKSRKALVVSIVSMIKATDLALMDACKLKASEKYDRRYSPGHSGLS